MIDKIHFENLETEKSNENSKGNILVTFEIIRTVLKFSKTCTKKE